MEAWVVALETPYFIKTDKSGNYKIIDVPAGDYVLNIWHEKLGADPVKVKVPKTGDVSQNFTIKKQ